MCTFVDTVAPNKGSLFFEALIAAVGCIKRCGKMTGSTNGRVNACFHERSTAGFTLSQQGLCRSTARVADCVHPGAQIVTH